MADTAHATAVPDWVLKFMDAIDTLEFDEGFAPLTEDSDMFFGTERIHGVEAIKAFFVKIDEPLNITHEVWSTGPRATASACCAARPPWPRRARRTRWCAPRSCTSSISTRKSRSASGRSASPRARFRPTP